MNVVSFDQLGGTARSFRFDGDDHSGAPVSVLVCDEAPGQGPSMHQHAYHEVFVVLEGQAELTAGEQTRPLGPGTVAVVEPGTVHGFTVTGRHRLRSVHIHASGRIRTSWEDPQ